MEKRIVTRRQGGSIESRSYPHPLQLWHGAQGKTEGGHCLGLSLERADQRTTPSSQGSHRNAQRSSDGFSGQPCRRKPSLQAERGQTAAQPHPVWLSDQSLSGSRVAKSFKIYPENQLGLHQELDRAHLARPAGLRDEDNGDRVLAPFHRTAGWNQIEDQGHPVHNLLPRSPLGTGGTQSHLRTGGHGWPSGGINRSASERQGLDSAGHSAAGSSPEGLGESAIARGYHGIARCGDRLAGLGIDRPEMEGCAMEDWYAPVGACLIAGGTEGNQILRQRSAIGQADYDRIASLARAHALSWRGGLDLRQSVLPRQDAVHVSDPLPQTHPAGDREGLRPQEQQAGADRLAYPATVAGNPIDLERRERQSHAVPAPPYHPDFDTCSVFPSRQFGSAEGARQGGSDGIAKGDVEEAASQASNFRAIEKAGIFIPASYGVLWRLKRASKIRRKSFRIMVSALGLEPRTHALKGRCSTN